MVKELKIIGSPEEIIKMGIYEYIRNNYEKFMYRVSYVDSDNTFTIPVTLNENRFNAIFDDASITEIILELISQK